MTAQTGPAAIAVFVAIFVAVSALGFVAARWRRPRSLAHLDEWGLGGRQFGVVITWFLVGGDFYTAYTVIAVPALVYGVGGYGFFALPYTILVYPFVFLAMPLLWEAAKRTGGVTAADVVRSETGAPALELAVGVTGLVATMPYIALQLVGMRAALRGLGLGGEIPLFVAFLILAVYTYSAGLRAPALIAFAKDVMIYIVVIVAVAAIPMKLGGYGAVFDAAAASFHARGHGELLVPPAQMLPYASLALGSALAAFFYPHTLTGIFAARDASTVRRNAVLLPAYTLLLGLIALLGYMAIAAHVAVKAPTDAVASLFNALFPAWFAGFAFAAIAVAALVPAAVMSIGAANLFTRNIWKPWVNRALDVPGEARVARTASLVVKLGALGFVLFLPTEFAIDLQLLGGLWILQTLPAVLFPLLTRRFSSTGLLAGWAAGQALGTWLFIASGLKPVHALTIAGTHVAVYIGVLALAANILVAAALSVVRTPARR